MADDRMLANQFLLAMPGMDDPNFARTVTLLCQHNGEGAMGLVLNRPTDFLVGELLEQLGIEGGSEELRAARVLWGGPVQTDRGFVLHDDPREWSSTLRCGPFAITTSREILHALARGDGPARYLVLLGHAGWGSEQLEGEIAQNAWLTAPAFERLIFEVPLEARWQAAADSIGVDLRRLTDYAGRA
jgi:putative transcriptional regulator